MEYEIELPKNDLFFSLFFFFYRYTRAREQRAQGLRAR